MEQPNAFTLGAKLPVNSVGKDIDWNIGYSCVIYS